MSISQDVIMAKGWKKFTDVDLAASAQCSSLPGTSCVYRGNVAEIVIASSINAHW